MNGWRPTFGRVVRVLAVGIGLAAGARAADDRSARVLILANRDDADSLRIARHYAEVRQVPAENVIALKLPRTETIAWREFVTTLWEPLLEKLVAARWIDATPMALTDAIGRRKYAPGGHRIAALVVCRGVPLKIANAPEFVTELPPPANRPEFRTNAGAVDAELSLLANPNYPITGFVPNPLFQNDRPTPFEVGQVVKVSRLDGPTAAEAYALVDRAVEAERRGLIGRAYVDLANRDKVGDLWLESTASQLAGLGFDTTIDRASAIMPATTRCDAPVLYFGWYASDVSGPFALPGFTFAPGAIALHIYSYSAATLSQPASGWTGPFVARGVTATVGNVYEPYLMFTHRPDLLLRALTRGQTLVDAAYYALPALSWQAIVIGDPLYRPFAVSLEEQLRHLPDIPAALSGHAVVRRMRQLDAAGRPAEATALALATQRVRPSFALALALAPRLREAGDVAGAGAELSAFATASRFTANDWAVAREAALLLVSCGRATQARDVWRVLFASEGLTDELRMAWLPEAIDSALAAKDAAQADAWRATHAELNRRKK